MYSYIHIPFCESKCKYCRFASIWLLNQKLVDIYIWYLLKEIKSYNLSKSKLKSVYFWGWTPSILSKNQLEKILYTLKDTFWFEENIEISLETTPQNISISNLEDWYNLWINRLSFWIQTLNNKSLKEINRTDYETIISSLEILKSSKIKNISSDFIIWLPHVWYLETTKDIEFLLKNYPYFKHISVYMLEDYYDVENENTDIYEKITYPNDWKSLWTSEEQISKEYFMIYELLQKKWFLKYELSNFSKPWFECHHNKSYWNHSDVIWFWLWAHSFVNNTRFANFDDFKWYYTLEKSYIEKLNNNDLFIEKIMFCLRTNWIDITDLSKLNNQSINDFISKNYLIKTKNKIILNPEFSHFLDYILKEIL